MINLESNAMMTKRRRRSKKWVYWLVFLVLFVAACYICYAVWDSYFNDNKKRNDETTSDVKEEERNEEKEDEKKENEEESDPYKKEEVIQYDGDNPNESDKITGVVTYAGVLNNMLAIRVNIDQYLGSGECALRLDEGGVNIYNDSANVVNLASTSTCEGFDIPIDLIGGGNFQIVIDVTADGRSGTITGEASI